MSSPAHKNALVQGLSKQVREWNNKIMVHESLRKLAFLLAIPENLIGVGQDYLPPSVYVRRSESIGRQEVNPDRILESDLLRWLLLSGSNQKRYHAIIKQNLIEDDLVFPPCRTIFRIADASLSKNLPIDLLALITDINAEEQRLISELSEKKVNWDKGEERLIETIQALLNRNWMRLKEEIKQKISAGQYSDEQGLEIVKQFDALNRNPPKVQIP